MFEPVESLPGNVTAGASISRVDRENKLLYVRFLNTADHECESKWYGSLYHFDSPYYQSFGKLVVRVLYMRHAQIAFWPTAGAQPLTPLFCT